jgi:hypothetical protein
LPFWEKKKRQINQKDKFFYCNEERIICIELDSAGLGHRFFARFCARFLKTNQKSHLFNASSSFF